MWHIRYEPNFGLIFLSKSYDLIMVKTTRQICCNEKLTGSVKDKQELVVEPAATHLGKQYDLPKGR